MAPPPWLQLQSVSPHWPSVDVTARDAQGQERATIGRHPRSEVLLADAHISSMHLVVEGTESDGRRGAWLHDKSTNGAFLNGKRIGKGNKELARSGDLVSFVVTPNAQVDGSYSYVNDPNLKWAAYKVLLQPPPVPILQPPEPAQAQGCPVAVSSPAPAGPGQHSVSRAPLAAVQSDARGEEGGAAPVQTAPGDKQEARAHPAEAQDHVQNPGRDQKQDCAQHQGKYVVSLKRPRAGEEGTHPVPAPAPDWGKPMLGDGGRDDDAGGKEFDKRYILKGKLGDGGYASVFKGVHKETSTEVAVKRIDFAKWRVYNNGISKAQLESEFAIHAQLQHPNVVRMHTVFKGAKWIYVVLEMVSGGDLFDYLIQKSQHGVEEKAARRWFAQLLDGVDYCHKQNVVHRDLKPENILLSHSSHDATLKIADFGLAKALTGRDVCRTNCGTPQYMAPEVHFMGDAKISKANGYGKEADLWGLGVILHVILTVTMPFGDDEDSQQLFNDINMHATNEQQQQDTRLLHGEVWVRQSTEVKSLVRGLLTADVKGRTTIEGARAHAWMRMPASATAGGSPFKKRQRPPD